MEADKTSPLLSLPIDTLTLIVDLCDDATYVSLYFTCKYFEATFDLSIEKDQMCNECMSYGYLELLQWARDNNCYWNVNTFANGARNGHLELLKWAHQNGCRRNALSPLYAARYGHLDILKWLVDTGCNWNPNACCLEAVREGHLEVTKWCKEQGAQWEHNICDHAALGGSIPMLRWLRFGEEVTEESEKTTLKIQGCSWTANTCACAAKRGHLTTLQWLRQHGCEWNSKTCTNAAANGHIEVLEWARGTSRLMDSDPEYIVIDVCDWDGNTAAAAIDSNNLSVVKYVVENHCPWDSKACLRKSGDGQYLTASGKVIKDEIVNYLHQVGCPCGGQCTRL